MPQSQYSSSTKSDQSNSKNFIRKAVEGFFAKHEQNAFLKSLNAIREYTIEPLRGVTLLYVSWIDKQTRTEGLPFSLAGVVFDFLLPWGCIITLLSIIKFATRWKIMVIKVSFWVMCLLFVAYDGGYSLAATTISLVKFLFIMAVLRGLPGAINAWLNSPTPSPTSSYENTATDTNSSSDTGYHSTSASSHDDSSSSSSSESDSFTAKDDLDREYHGSGDTMYRDTPGDPGTFDRHNDGTWTSRYGDEVIKEKGPGD